MQTLCIDGIVRTPPALVLTHAPEAPTNGSVTVTVSSTVYGLEAGNALAVVKWAEGAHAASFFEAAGNTITSEMSFTVSRNGGYTVYAQDLAGNEVLANTEIANINTETPGISVSLEPGTPTKGNVAVTVTATVYGADNTLSWIRWRAEDGEAVELPFTEVVDESEQLRTFAAQATALENGAYLVKVRDAAGNEKTQSVGGGDIFRMLPVIHLTAPTEPMSGGVTITAALQAIGAMNTVEFAFWAPGRWTAEQFDDVAGTEAPSGGFPFTVFENGWYTVFAQDAAGNRQAASIQIANIVKLPPLETMSLTFASVAPDGAAVKLTFDRELDASATIAAAAALAAGVDADADGVEIVELAAHLRYGPADVNRDG